MLNYKEKIDELEAKATALRDEAWGIQKEAQRIRKEWAEAEGPCKPGDTIVVTESRWDRLTRTYRRVPLPFLVLSITRGDHGFEASGSFLKMNGQPMKRRIMRRLPETVELYRKEAS